jgi:hypothetical protein
MNITYDARDVKRVFNAYPVQSVKRLNQLIEGGAIDVQREMRMAVNVGATGETRRSINYKTGNLSAEISSNLDPRRIAALEKGSRPHWTSARPGSPLHKWATHKGINPYAVQKSIAAKGTKAHPFIKPTFQKMRGPVERDILQGFGQFIGEVNNGRI